MVGIQLTPFGISSFSGATLVSWRIPICSMYGIFIPTFTIRLKLMVNVGINIPYMEHLGYII